MKTVVNMPRCVQFTESSPEDNDWRVLVDEDLDMTHQCVRAAYKVNCVMGYLKRNVARKSEGDCPLLCSRDLPPGALCSVLGPPRQEGHGPVAVGQEKGL